MIIEDDPGETEPTEEVVPYQLTKDAIVLDVKVQDIKVHYVHVLVLMVNLACMYTFMHHNTV